MTRVGFVGVGVGRLSIWRVVLVPVFSFAWLVRAEAARAIAGFVPGLVRRVLVADVCVASVGIGPLRVEALLAALLRDLVGLVFARVSG
jgi:hypothetical protein